MKRKSRRGLERHYLIVRAIRKANPGENVRREVEGDVYFIDRNTDLPCVPENFVWEIKELIPGGYMVKLHNFHTGADESQIVVTLDNGKQCIADNVYESFILGRRARRYHEARDARASDFDSFGHHWGPARYYNLDLLGVEE